MSASADIAIHLATRLADISIANGYSTDAGLHVYRGKRRIDIVPAITIIEGEDVVENNTLRSAHIKQQYMIEAHDNCDGDNPNDKGHLLLSDLKKAIFGGDITLSKSVRTIYYKGRNITPREDGSSIVATAILIEVNFVEDLTNP